MLADVVCEALLQHDELVFPRSHAELFGVLEGFFPLDVRVRVEEVVVVVRKVRLCSVDTAGVVPVKVQFHLVGKPDDASVYCTGANGATKGKWLFASRKVAGGCMCATGACPLTVTKASRVTDDSVPWASTTLRVTP